MQPLHNRFYTLPAFLGLMLVLVSGSAMAQYKVRYLDADVVGRGTYFEPLLGNAWGLAYAPGGTIWVSDESTGWSTLYNAAGIQQSLEVVVPTASGTGFGTPTGIVFNGSQEFA